MPFYGYGYGYGRNTLCRAPALNPEPSPVHDISTGNAGRDGYTRTSAADRETRIRNIPGCTPVYQGPGYED